MAWRISWSAKLLFEDFGRSRRCGSSPISHINLLELKSVEKLVEEKAKVGQAPFVNLVDSNVARCALGGPPPRLCQQYSGEFLRLSWSPLDRGPRPSVSGVQMDLSEAHGLWHLAALRTCVKLATLRCLIVQARLATERIILPDAGIPYGSSPICRHCPFGFSKMDFDVTFGFFGEGPMMASRVCPSRSISARHCLSWILFQGLWFLPCVWHGRLSILFWPFRVPLMFLAKLSRLSCLLCWALAFSGRGGACAMTPNKAAEQARAEERQALGLRLEGRPKLPVTGKPRERYWSQFESWLEAEGIDFERLWD